MRKKTILLIALFMFVMALVACGGSEPTPTAVPTEAPPVVPATLPATLPELLPVDGDGLVRVVAVEGG